MDSNSDSAEAGFTVAAPTTGPETELAVGTLLGESARSMAAESPLGPDESPPSEAESPPAGAKKQRRRRPRILVPAAIAVVAITAAGVIGCTIAKNNTASEPGPVAVVLDGDYRLDWDGANRTTNGAPAPVTAPINTLWWAFRSSCGSTGCVATGTGLDKENHQVARTPATTASFHFAGGHWQRTPAKTQEQYPRCLGADGKIAAGQDTEMVAWSLDPQPDGTLRGTQTMTVLTDECGTQGTVWQTPFVAKRIGDVPPTVTVADPETVGTTPTTNSPIPTAAGVTALLNGTFQVEYEWANQTVNGHATTVSAPPTSAWWAYRSLCTSAGCVATGTELAKETQQAPVSGGKVLRFVDGHWQDAPELQDPAPCPGATNGKPTRDETTAWSWEPQPDGTLRGIQTVTVLTNECGTQGNVYRTPLLAIRTGDVPPAVVLADPALFVPSPAPPNTRSHP